MGYYNYSNELYHYGVKGMRWGVRRFQDKNGRLTNAGKNRYREVDEIVKERDNLKIKSKTKSGSDVTLDHNHTPAFSKFLAKHNKKVRETLKNSKSFKIKAEDKTIGEMDLYKESKDSINVVWVSIDESQRGKGYATAVMNAAIKYAKQTGCKQVTLEVPGNSPDARHIYEKLGFKDVGKVSNEGDVWDGLTSMRLDLDKDKR